jgi:hypothetical protein
VLPSDFALLNLGNKAIRHAPIPIFTNSQLKQGSANERSAGERSADKAEADAEVQADDEAWACSI